MAIKWSWTVLLPKSSSVFGEERSEKNLPQILAVAICQKDVKFSFLSGSAGKRPPGEMMCVGTVKVGHLDSILIDLYF